MSKPVFAALSALVVLGTPIPALAQSAHPNSVQPETTLSITAEASVTREPDLALLSAGVQTEADTAKQAMRDNAEAMSGVFDALSQAGVAQRDMQTSNFSLQPRYDYSSRKDAPPNLVGYTASNQLTVKVRDLGSLGETMDALVTAGGNTFSGLSFGLDDPSEAKNEARTLAMEDALARATLYANAAGLRVSRIVTIDEGYNSGLRPMAMMAREGLAAASATPVASGEVAYSASVSVLFELVAASSD